MLFFRARGTDRVPEPWVIGRHGSLRAGRRPAGSNAPVYELCVGITDTIVPAIRTSSAVLFAANDVTKAGVLSAATHALRSLACSAALEACFWTNRPTTSSRLKDASSTRSDYGDTVTFTAALVKTGDQIIEIGPRGDRLPGYFQNFSAKSSGTPHSHFQHQTQSSPKPNAPSTHRSPGADKTLTRGETRRPERKTDDRARNGRRRPPPQVRRPQTPFRNGLRSSKVYRDSEAQSKISNRDVAPGSMTTAKGRSGHRQA